MAYASLTIVLERVTQLLTVADNFISAAEDELQLLKTEVNILQSFLEQAAKLPKRDELFRKGERQILEAADTIGKTIDTSLSRAQNRTKLLPRVFNRNRLCPLAQDVEYLRKHTVKPALEDVNQLFDEMLGRAKNQISSDQIHKHPCRLRQHNIVCLKHEQDTIIKCLLETSEKLDVISIIGMAGLGKTTLAWRIFHNLVIESEFPVRIWVSISPDFKCKNVLLEILRCFIFEDMSGLNEKDLSHKIHLYLERKKFLVVIDDVWSIDVWNAIRDALPKNNRESKVLITSRYPNVGRQVDHTRESNHLRFMTGEESWELLELEVFGRRYGCPKELIQIGSHIAKQCDGLPLAIRDMGQVLVKKFGSEREMTKNVNEWDMVSKNMTYFLKDKKQQCETLNFVASSYNRLPHDLRDCFLYLAVFPENYEIPVWTLMNLWIAEGLIHHKLGKSLEETAEENLMDLIRRNLVMVVKTNHLGKIKTCRIHVAIHIFCRSKAETAERNLFQERKMSMEGLSEPQISDIEKYNHVCIHSDLEEFLSTNSSINLRSLLCFPEEPDIQNSDRISTNPNYFCSPRVLAANSVKITQFPEEVTKLSHLSYITLCGDDLVIPEAISQLWKLQTIVVDTESHVLTIKANIWRMILLKQVKTKAAIILDIQEKGGNAGENLQTLNRLSPISCTRGVSGRAQNLKKLGIRGQLATLDAKSLRKLVRLENLKLVNDSASENELRPLPHQTLNYFPGNIKILTLSATNLGWEHMSKLGKFDTLQVLKLTNNAFIGPSWICTGDPNFRRLEFLLIATTDLVDWEASTDYFPSLRSLALKSCQKLSKIPMGLSKSLKKLDVESVSNSAVESARKIEEKGKASGFKLSINKILDAADRFQLIPVT